MQPEDRDGLKFLAGDVAMLSEMSDIPSKRIFDREIISFLEALSLRFMKDKEVLRFPEIVTLGFWLRKSSVYNMEKRFGSTEGRLGRGVAFHIAPSNVPVNFAYSLFTGLLSGNANIVRVSSKDFEQIDIITKKICEELENHPVLKPYICIIKYDRNRKDITDKISLMTDVRVIWGGDDTIANIRKSPLPPRSTEITFADRFSLSVIDSDAYLEMVSEDKEKQIATAFFNDTYLSDQNACTSPRLIVWMGNNKEKAKEIFWQELFELVKTRYALQDISAVDKLSAAYKISAVLSGCEVVSAADNRLIRVSLPKVTKDIISIRESAGYFYEYSCDDILDLRELCDDRHVQTIGLLGERKLLEPLLDSGIHGIDRIVPIGKTMDFDYIWDGYDLIESMSRKVEF